MFPVKDIMTKNVISVKFDTQIYDAIECLVKNRVSGLPVVDYENNLVGVISEWDLLNLLIDVNLSTGDIVENFMTKDVISFKEDDSVMDVCDFLKKANKRRAPIIRDGKLVGVVSRHDIIKLILDIRKKVNTD